MIYNGYPSLKLGFSKSQVIALLGEPDSEMFDYKYPDEKKIIGSTYSYYLTRKEKRLAMEEDQMLFVYFNPKEEMYWVHSQNMGLEDIGKLRENTIER